MKILENNKNYALVIKDTNWLLSRHWGHYGNALLVSQKPQPCEQTSRSLKPWKWGMMDKVCWSFHQSTPCVLHTSVKQLSCEAWRPNSYQYRLTTGLCPPELQTVPQAYMKNMLLWDLTSLCLVDHCGMEKWFQLCTLRGKMSWTYLIQEQDD